ncbi:hypothetical protein [Streptomyces sp. 6N223]|uniref:hypothetical protein n=1 Tax=Streptomyces sp. 6N223 TaxID=3457412 RepID=UPI003FD13AB1
MPIDTVYAVVQNLARELADVFPGYAELAELQYSVFAPRGEPRPHASHAEAVASASAAIAGTLCYEVSPGSVWTVFRFGDGLGLVLQEVRGGVWQSQYCYVIDTDHRVHTYCHWHR